MTAVTHLANRLSLKHNNYDGLVTPGWVTLTKIIIIALFVEHNSLYSCLL